MAKIFLLASCFLLPLFALEIIDKPIDFGPNRIVLTRQYIKQHYGIDTQTIRIVPRMIVIHYTAIPTLDKSWKAFKPQTLPGNRADIARASALNVSAHYLVDRNGTIYRLMPETRMARHVIGLNHCAIGIENVGSDDLTPAQLEANRRLIEYLMRKYPTIRYLIGHYEYRHFEGSPLWLEKDAGYRTQKSDPGRSFMEKLRTRFPSLKNRP
ncbi:N-acetylmuramoyl-L-alanine amidase [Hydrogenimonas urashimensis]|uniref:N-acetylmuramoyl-L-alanine amidase n=1 Tax=Hydrogenimonas urashimensis TaxID=2740515 RepID=UPI0019167690|nr:peptidoglycan recognition family protein [Hydrogenimonas urashimensis]